MLQIVWCFFSIFWWWLLHCSASLLSTKEAIDLKILSVRLKCLFRKWLLWIYKNQWYFLFSSRLQCPNFWLLVESSKLFCFRGLGESLFNDFLEYFLVRVGEINLYSYSLYRDSPIMGSSEGRGVLWKWKLSGSRNIALACN